MLDGVLSLFEHYKPKTWHVSNVATDHVTVVFDDLTYEVWCIEGSVEYLHVDAAGHLFTVVF